MATVSRITPAGHAQYSDASTLAAVTPTGWVQATAAGGGGSTSAVSLIHGLTRANLTSGRLVA